MIATGGRVHPAEQVAVYVGEGRCPLVVLEVQNDTAHVELPIDENHCQALVLALQAAIAEVQARAVSL